MKNRTILAISIVAVGLVLVEGAATADEPAPSVRSGFVPAARPPRFTIALFGESLFALPDGYSLFSDERAYGGGGISVGFTVARPSERLALDLRLDGSSAKTDRRWQLGRTTLETQSLAIGAALRYQVRPWLRPYARLAVGATRGEIELAAEGADLTGESVAPFGTAAAGVALHVRLSRRPDKPWELSFFGEIGQSVGGKLTFDVTSERSADVKDPIAVQSISAGSLQRSLPQARVGVALHF